MKSQHATWYLTAKNINRYFQHRRPFDVGFLLLQISQQCSGSDLRGFFSKYFRLRREILQIERLLSSNDDNKEGVVETKVMMGTRMLMISKMIKIELVLVLRRALDVLALQRRRSCINDKMLMPQIWTLFMFFFLKYLQFQLLFAFRSQAKISHLSQKSGGKVLCY